MTTESVQQLGEPAASDETPQSSEKPRINRFVFIGSAAAVLLFTVLALVQKDATSEVLGKIVAWISEYLGWWYFGLALVLIVFVVIIALSRFGRIRLGPDDSRPQFNLFSWVAMLFAAGIGADLMFYSVAEPMAQYMAPPTEQPQSIAAAEQAVVWTLFHYGLSGWAMYAVMGMALAFFAFRRNLPLSIRSALHPIFGDRVNGRLGDAIDLAAILGTVFGIATSLGISISLLNAGLTVLFGVPKGLGAQIGLVVAAVVLATASAVSGVNKGIRRLSELSVILSLVLIVYVLFSSNPGFLLNAMLLNIGDYFSGLFQLSLDTMPYEEMASADVTTWKSSWTMFFWAWWVAWAPFVGLFLARISKGRTIRQFVIGVLFVPFIFIVLWVTVFGNAAIARIRGGANKAADPAFGQLIVDAQYAEAFYSFLSNGAPIATVVILLATVTGFLYYVTSADSGALVLGNFSSRLPNPTADCGIPARIFWSIAIGALTIALMVMGGANWLTTLTGATIVTGLPFSIVLGLVAIGLYRGLSQEFRTSKPNS